MNYQKKEIEGYPGYYIDTNGDVWSCIQKKALVSKGIRGTGGFKSFIDRNKCKKLKHGMSNGKYKITTIYDRKGGHKCTTIHKIVLETFISKRPDKMQACHNNGNSLDNRIINLRWDTCRNNNLDKARHGTWQSGEKASHAKLNGKIVRTIRYAFNFGTPIYHIARLTNVSHGGVSHIVKRRSWIEKQYQITI